MHTLMAAALLGLHGTLALSAGLVNGSFEDPAAGTMVYYGAGSHDITGWSVTGPGEVQLTPGGGLPASDGQQWVDLTGLYGYNKGLLSDPFDVTPGVTYHISFDIGNYLPFGVSTVGVTINGEPELLFTHLALDDTATAPMNWGHYSLDWTATDSTATLMFIGRENGAFSNNGGIGLDNVVVSQIAPVPEPGTGLLMAMGLAGLLGWRRRSLPAHRPQAGISRR